MSKEDVMVEHKCPNCGISMLIGKLTGDAAFTGQATLTWIDNKKGWRSRKHLDSFCNPKGVRAYRCRECGIFIFYEQRKQPE